MKKAVIFLTILLIPLSVKGKCLKKGCHKTINQLKVLHSAITEGSCEDCHTRTGKHSFKLESTGTELCLNCHENPVRKGENPHPAVTEGECTDCHNPHGSVSKKWSKNLKEKLPPLCYECHETFENEFPHPPVVVGDCIRCHNPHSSPDKHLLVKTGKELCFICHYDDLSQRDHIHPAVEEGCTVCHNPHGSDNPKLLSSPQPSLCYDCHESKEEGKVVHGVIKKKGCTACHSPHGSDFARLLPADINVLCSRCHPKQKDGGHIFPGIKKLHPVMGVKDPSTNKPLSCISCHNPHSSDNPKLFYMGKTKLEMCKKCHKKEY